MKKLKLKSLGIVLLSMLLITDYAKAAGIPVHNEHLSDKDKSIILISSLTAQGKLADLKIALDKGLDAGLTINEIKEALIHTYAYCGFPRSIRGLQTFMEVLTARKAKGLNDLTGKESTPIVSDLSKYERGKKILGDLTKTPQPEVLSGYSAFAPTMDTFLKEHLFADIFERDVLDYAQRELVTISVISAIGDADPMLRSHLSISLNVGWSATQLKEFITIITPTLNKEKALAAHTVLNEVLKNNK
jgi:4-carboxymuconolactone decarboxylase